MNELKSSRYFAILMDGSTDSSVTEKELVYVLFVCADGRAKCCFFCMKDVADATAPGIKTVLENALADLGAEDWQWSLVTISVDGAAVNLGACQGLAALLRQELPWLVTVHCLNHWLELAVKNAFANTYMDEVLSMLTNLYYMYEKSPKRLRELKALADILEEAVRKPEKARGTRWLQHKSRAVKSLLLGYPVICTHLESMVSEESSVKAADKERFKSYLTKLTSFKFVLHILFFEALLNPLAGLSCHLQGSSADLPFALAKLKSCRSRMQTFKAGDPENPTELSKFVAAAEEEDSPHFCSVKLCRVQPNTLTAFNSSRVKYVDAICRCIHGRFDDFEKDVFKAVSLLETKLWATDRGELAAFGLTDLSVALEHFKAYASEEQRVSTWDRG